MPDAERSLWITHNGEIYNYPQLREDLEGRVIAFARGAITKSILHFHKSEGSEFVRRLNGMFAIAIWEEQRGQPFRPFRYQTPLLLSPGGSIAFASEAKGLLELPGCLRRLNALHQYLEAAHAKTVDAGSH